MTGCCGRGQPFLPEKSHVISLGQFLMCRENVGIATTRFQSLKDVSGNYVRHLWGTMRVCHALAGNPYFLGLAVDSRIVRTGLKVWRCTGCGEDLVDEVDTLWRGQEWTVLGVLVEMPHEGVEAGVGDADALGGDTPRSAVCVGVCVKNNRWTVDDVDGDVIRPQDGGLPVVGVFLDGQ